MKATETASTAGGACPLCGDCKARYIKAREMMFGFHDEFTYRECQSCGSLQLVDVPSDLSRYYPAHYGSFQNPQRTRTAPGSRLKRWLRANCNSGQILRKPAVGRFLARLRPGPGYDDLAAYFRHVRGATFDMRILDVGCGSGALLFRLESAGFMRLFGVDPYLHQDVEAGPRIRILAADTTALEGQLFDFIMLHHSLEHMLDQHKAMNEIKRLLAPRGTCLIRIPVAGSDPWNRYGADWVELDAPRHICLHTPRSLTILAERSGLEVVHTEFDSDDFTYWASDLYRRGLPLVDLQSKSHTAPRMHFTQRELEDFRDLACRANSAGTGGRAAFYLRHQEPASRKPSIPGSAFRSDKA